MSLKSTLFRSALMSLHMTRLYDLAPAALSGAGVIFMLHRVRPTPDHNGFAPNAILEITPDYLNAVLMTVRSLGYDFVSLDEALYRLRTRKLDRKFAAFTLDDGYHDNLQYAAPIFARHGAPFTVYVSSGLPDATAELWWMGLEEVIRSTDHLATEINGTPIEMTCATADEKQAAFDAVYWPLRNQNEIEQRTWIRNLCDKYQVDLTGITRDAALTWDGVRQLHNHAHCTIGAHTIDHFALSKLAETEARHEILGGANRIAEMTGEWPRHFAYPYGDEGSAGPREFELARFLGFDSATTTRKGFVTEAHGINPHAIPRLSLNGDYQDLRMLKVLMSGLPFALAKMLPSVETA
ncbi:MAG: polysaccharide deacetylase family protein [Parvibaculum sp.]